MTLLYWRYYKELEHLREMLKLAREEILQLTGGAKLEVNQKMEDYILNTEVFYFDIVESPPGIAARNTKSTLLNLRPPVQKCLIRSI